ncbi:MAG: HAD-superfamily hydrolase, subfamily variant 3 [Acidobacteria bacterium]|nr:HAD-superfamily hydrolase, subfamily variant 3 [Acidobacteriota bacterium]
MSTKAVCFDVDFTLIYPGPTFRGEGYRAFCARYGMDVDASKFEAGVASAAPLLESPDDVYDPAIFIAYTNHIIQRMGGTGARIDECSREIYHEWAACHHFELYDDVAAVMGELADAGVRIGLISNTHRCLASFQSHFELQGLISATISSSDHGLMKPHPSIFTAALQRLGVEPGEAVMVGDSFKHDVEGALNVGMRAVLLNRGDAAAPRVASDHRVPVIHSLHELPPLVIG